jgi:hypothetical protein
MTEPSRYVQPDVSEARIHRVWGNVSARLQARPSRAWRWVVLCTALSGVAGGAIFLAKTRLGPASPTVAPSVLSVARLETAGDPLAVTLVDGSQVALASHSEVQVRGNEPTAVALALSRGEVVCDVTHRPGRRFTVVAGDVEVRVVGTKFSVKTTSGDAARVEVSVLRGVVEVSSKRRPGVVARVAAGQSWIQDIGPSLRGSAAPDDGVSLGPAPGAVSPSETQAEVEPKSEAKGGAAAGASPSARDLFERAGESRRAGDAAAAARAYEELLRLHPSDGRASLSAFELGRLRMDRLGDPSGAINALERALALNVGPSFREDALARLVSVHASQGNFSACARARDRYLSSYPAGVHASAVATRCGSR